LGEHSAGLGEVRAAGRVRRLWLLVALALGCAACSHYRPTLPMGARTGDVDLTLVFLRLTVRPEFVLESRSTAPHTLVRGWLTVPTRSPCGGGLEAKDLIIDEGRTQPGTLPAGVHQINVRVPIMESIDYSLDTVVDLEIEDGLCMRAPVISQSIPLLPDKHPMLVVTSGLLANPDISGLGGVASIEAGPGLWLGPIFLDVQAGIGAALCTPSACGRDSAGDVRHGLAVPFALEARYGLGSSVNPALASSFFAGSRYAFIPLRLPATDGERSFNVHTLVGVLGWGFADAAPGPFRHLEHAVPIELALPLGIVVEPNGPNRRVAFTGGMELRFLFSL